MGIESLLGGAGSLIGGAAKMAGSPLIAGQAWSSPFQLGAMGLGMASAFGGGGGSSSMMTLPVVSPAIRKLDKTTKSKLKSNLNTASRGDVRDKAFGDIGKLRTSEGRRALEVSDVVNTAVNSVSNPINDGRGSVAAGGSMVRANIAESGERMAGLFAPSSVLNAYKRQELVNAMNDIATQKGTDLRVSSGIAGLQSAKDLAGRLEASDKGAAIGELIGGIGRSQLMSSYLNQKYPPTGFAGAKAAADKWISEPF
jgi:hypothetical protein